MKAIEVAEFGDPCVLRPVERPDPEPASGEVLVDVQVVDVMSIDAQLRGGWGREFFGLVPPYVPGTGVAGRVAAVGDGVSPDWVGRAVVARVAIGGYAERVVVPEPDLVPVPSGVDLLRAAALLQSGAAAVRLVDAAGITAGDRVLVAPATGALGSLLVQLARAAGATTYALGRRPESLRWAEGLGAIGIEDPAAVAGEIDIVFDGVGGGPGRAAFELLGQGGRFFAYGVLEGTFAKVAPDEATAREIRMAGIEELQFDGPVLAELAARALSLAAEGRLVPMIGSTYSLDHASDAHAAIEAGTATGKTLLVAGRVRAVRYRRFGGPEVLEVEDVPRPEPGPGEVRVRVAAVGVNAVDWKIRRGLFADEGAGPDGPQGTGIEVAGVVEAVGPGVTTPAIGEPVFGAVASGAAATHVLAKAADLLPRLAWLDVDMAAALPVAAETAYRTLNLLGPTRSLLIHAVAGGVGLVAAQLALSRGVRVVGTASPRHHDFLRSIGVTPIAYGDGWEERAAAAASDGIDAVLDASGRGVIAGSVSLTGDPARVVTIADPTAETYGVRFSSSGAAPLREVFDTVLPLVRNGQITMPIEARLPLDKIAEAHRLSEAGHLRGKVVLLVA